MRVRIESRTIELHQGDITDEQTDCIVNAANARLAGGGGVDGAIHRAAGPSLMDETRRLYPEGCPTGSAVLTTAGDLAARHVAHAVGPVWHGGEQGEDELLASAYRTCLELARDHDCRSIAFPAISTGVYGYPLDLASRTALGTVIDFHEAHDRPELVRFVLFDGAAYGAFSAALEELTAG